jgi:hypothetical protein
VGYLFGSNGIPCGTDVGHTGHSGIGMFTRGTCPSMNARLVLIVKRSVSVVPVLDGFEYRIDVAQCDLIPREVPRSFLCLLIGLMPDGARVACAAELGTACRCLSRDVTGCCRRGG